MRVASVALFAIVAVAADWPRFRGPNGTGTADVPAILLTAATPATAAWTLALPGGFSSPVIVDGKLFIQSSSADGATRLFHRIDPATGAIVWTQTRPGKPGHIHAKNSLASGTPAADADRVYCVFWDGIGLDLCAYDHAGTAVWAKPLGPFASQHGPGVSPIVHAGLVVVNVDQDGAAEVVAFDAKTGTEAWRAKRKPFRACYTPPVVRPLADGATELVVASTAGLTGYDPTTGRIHWNWDWPFAGMALRTIGTPVLVDDLVIAAAGDGGGSRSLVAIRPGPNPSTGLGEASRYALCAWPGRRWQTPLLGHRCRRGHLRGGRHGQ